MTAATPLVPRADRFWTAVAASAAVHVAAAGLALARRPPALVDLEQKPIVARLVRLGEKRPEHLLPRKEEAAPQEASAPASGPPAPPAPPAAPRPGASPAPRAGAPAPRGPDAFAAALSRIRRDRLRQEPTAGDPSGDPLGDTSEPSAGDRYLALVQRALHEVYDAPLTISERDRAHLRANLVLHIEASGTVAGWDFESRSGNAAFDEALARAVRSARLPPPPPDLRKRVRGEGLLVRFSM
ncbi:MAG TPA: TonB C-terminal domain-containing protein [Anaeromyxobacteraceae bacterium]